MELELENKRKMLIFRSGHRGTKEMDLIMESFARAHVPFFSPEELAIYEDLLGESDPDLYNWITGQEEPPAHIAAIGFFAKLKTHKICNN